MRNVEEENYFMTISPSSLHQAPQVQAPQNQPPNQKTASPSKQAPDTVHLSQAALAQSKGGDADGDGDGH